MAWLGPIRNALYPLRQLAGAILFGPKSVVSVFQTVRQASCAHCLLEPRTRRAVVESQVLRPTDFRFARNSLFVLCLHRPLSGSNSVGRMPASQAGRRGFESRLPLHLFNNLRAGSRMLQLGYQGKQGNRREPSCLVLACFQRLEATDCQPVRLEVNVRVNGRLGRKSRVLSMLPLRRRVMASAVRFRPRHLTVASLRQPRSRVLFPFRCSRLRLSELASARWIESGYFRVEM